LLVAEALDFIPAKHLQQDKVVLDLQVELHHQVMREELQDNQDLHQELQLLMVFMQLVVVEGEIVLIFYQLQVATVVPVS
jgi:hypothetical protein